MMIGMMRTGSVQCWSAQLSSSLGSEIEDDVRLADTLIDT